MDYLENLTTSLSSRFGDVIPGVLGALLVLILGFFIAGIVRRIAVRLMSKTSIDERLGAKLNTSFRIDKFVGKLLYYLVVLLTLLIVLNLLGVESVLAPLENMVGEFLGYIPNIIAAGIIGFAGYIIAQIGSEATAFVSEKLEGYSDRMGLDAGSVNISQILKQFVFLIIFVPILIIALDTLNMKAISEPATEMLSSLLEAVPMILAAGILVAVFYIVGRFVTNFVSDLLHNIGFDDLASNLGISKLTGSSKPSRLIGNIIFFFIMFTGLIAAADKLELGQLSEILGTVLNIAGKIFFGLVVLLAGVFMSNIAVKALSASQGNGWMIPIARFAILGIFLAFALHTMGIAESIVNLAFGLTLGAIAVAFALSFGLGGREAAGRQMQEFFNKINR
jgi:hypothetical protein